MIKKFSVRKFDHDLYAEISGLDSHLLESSWSLQGNIEKFPIQVILIFIFKKFSRNSSNS